MSLDETCLSNGEVYTILTNKAAYGRKGAIAMMVRGVASETVVEVLRKIPITLRVLVETITTELSSAMMLTVKTAFPNAMLINDRFHVQQLVCEAIDQLRISCRWLVLEQENQQIKAHKEKRKAAKSKSDREAIGIWQPEKMENGETMPEIMARSRHIILKHCSKWNEQQTRRAYILFDKFPDLQKAYNVYLELINLYNKKSKPEEAKLNLARWYNKVEKLGNNQFNKVIDTFKNHYQTIINYFQNRLTNAFAGSFNAKIKAFRIQFRGVGYIKFLCIDWQNFMLSTLLYQQKKSVDPYNDERIKLRLNGMSPVKYRAHYRELNK